MDLHCTDTIIFAKETTGQPPFAGILIDPYEQETIDLTFTDTYQLPQYIPPYTRALFCTEEEVEFGKDQIGLVVLRHTFALLGLVANTAVVDPKYKGQLTLAVYNSSGHRIHIKPKERMWGMYEVNIIGDSTPIYKGRYQGSVGIVKPKAFDKPLGSYQI